MSKKRPLQSEQTHLYVVPLGRVDALTVSILAANLQTVMGLNAEILPPLPVPEYAYVPLRTQYSAGKILSKLESVAEDGVFKLGVIQSDICTPILKFVFGESQLGGKTAVLSLARLGCEDPERMYLRAAKIAIHEVGHLLRIGHCHAVDCLMAFSSNLEKLDMLPLRFCSACEYEISRSLRNYVKQSTPPA